MRQSNVLAMVLVLCLPCAMASLQAVEHVPVRGWQLQTTVNSVAGLTSALSDSSVSHILVEAGHYGLSAELSVTRSVTIEAVVAGTVVLDAQANNDNRRRVLTINPGSDGVVHLIGLNITGGFVVSACILNVPGAGLQ